MLNRLPGWISPVASRPVERNEQAGREAEAVGSGVRLVVEHGAQLEAGAADLDAVAGLQAEPLEQDVGRRGAEHAVAFGEQIGQLAGPALSAATP